MTTRTTCRWSKLLLAGCIALGGCGADATEGEGEPPGCGDGEIEVAEGVCCPEGTRLLPDGACRDVGVPPGGCGDGFVSDGAFGCNPILPATACLPGQLATPGDEACHPVGACGEGPWGDIPGEVTTQYVDGSHVGSSDGSPASPWTTVTEAVAAASPGAIVAIAAGVYVEDVLVEHQPVRLWGRCPAMVEIRGAGARISAVMVADGATASEIRDLTITGSRWGLVIVDSEAVIVDRVWIHDTGGHGLHGERVARTTSLRMSGSLVEAAAGAGVAVIGAAVQIQGSAIRDTWEDDLGANNVGLQSSVVDGVTPGDATVTQSAITGGAGAGMVVSGASLTADSVYVSGTRYRALGIQLSQHSGASSNAIVTRSVLEHAGEVGVTVSGSTATLEGVVVRDILSLGTGQYGVGVMAQNSAVTGARSNVTLRYSAIERTRQAGIGLVESDSLLEHMVVTDTAPVTHGFGDGVAVVALVESATATMAQMYIANNARAGVSAFGGHVTMGQASLWCNAVHLDGESQYELNSMPRTIPFGFEDLGGCLCACGAEEPGNCKVESSGIAPPAPL